MSANRVDSNRLVNTRFIKTRVDLFEVQWRETLLALWIEYTVPW